MDLAASRAFHRRPFKATSNDLLIDPWHALAVPGSIRCAPGAPRFGGRAVLVVASEINLTNRILRFAGVVAGGLCWAVSLAQPSTASGTAALTLPAAIDAAWQRALSARAAEGDRRRAEADRAASGRWWAAPPAWEISHSGQRSGASRTETEVGLSWPLWLPGQRAAQGAAADASAARAVAATDAARLQVAGQVRESAWAIVEQQALLADVQAQHQTLQRLADDVDRRVRAGDLARADALAARAEVLALVAQAAEARQRLDAARVSWTVLTGWTDAPLAPDLDERTASSARVTPCEHPEQRLAAMAVEQARRQLDLVRTSRRDAPEVTVGWRRETSGTPEPTQQSLVLGLRVPWGTSDRQAPREAAAQAELDVALTAEQRTRDRIAAESAGARTAVQQAQQQYEAEVERARLLRERATLIERSFRAGETPLPDLLRALAAAAQADASVTRRAAALGLAHARLQQTLGLMP